MILISEKDFKFLRGGDVLIKVRNKRIQDFCKKHYINKENYKYYNDNDDLGKKVIIQCPNGTKENPYMQSSIQGTCTENRLDGANWYYGHSVYPDECSPTFLTEIKMAIRKIIYWIRNEI